MMVTRTYIGPDHYHEYDVRLIPRWIYGGPIEVWLTNIDVIDRVIKKYKLKPIPPESLPSEIVFGVRHSNPEPTTTAAKSRGRIAPRPIPFPGGIRAAHMHYKGGLYMLDDKQWADFSGKVVERLQAKLDKASTVNFEQFVNLSSAIDSL